MLQRLHIRNYAIIDDLTIDFHPLFNIITGETGAGKSILMGALGLVLGNRADTAVLYNDTAKCFVEAAFSLNTHPRINQLLQDNDLDVSNEVIVRREIAPNGKSRSFINDTPVTLNILRQFAAQLVDLHQQFDTLDLGDDDFQRSVVDALAGHDALLLQYKKCYLTYQSTNRALGKLQEQQAEANKAADYNRYLFNELEEINLSANELELLDEELNLLSNAENIKSALQACTYNLSDGEQPLVQQLKVMIQQLQALKSQHSGITACIGRLQSAQIELQDITGELDSINDGINMDAERLQTINDRISIGYKLLKKHNAANTDELLGIYAALGLTLQEVLNMDADILTLKKQLEHLQSEAMTMAKTMSTNRKKNIPGFETEVKKLLSQVGMPNAQLRVNIETTAVLQADGIDTIRFLFDANKTGRFEPLEKVASGGELSRLMLSIKSLVAQSMQLPTLIFDEIDTGISGEAARQVGIIMKGLAQHRQIIAITHQPQIAARANAHFYVYKREEAQRIKTGVRLLTHPERVETIAAMLSGDQHTEASKKIAQEMIESL